MAKTEYGFNEPCSSALFPQLDLYPDTEYAPDWQQVGFVAADLGWKSLQQRNCALLKMAEAVVANQSALQQDMQQAWAQWQHDCTRALREASGAMPLSTTFETLLAPATRPALLPDGKS